MLIKKIRTVQRSEKVFLVADLNQTELSAKLTLTERGNGYRECKPNSYRKAGQNNFPMTNFLMGKGYCEYIEGDLEEDLEIPEENATTAQIKAFKEWNQGARKVLHWLSLSISDSILGHIQDAMLPKEAWDSLVKLFAVNTKARKLQFKTELNTLEKMSML